jgi:hypothetical protein
MQNLKDLFNVDLPEATFNTASGATAATINNSAGVIWNIPLAGGDVGNHQWLWQIDGNDFVNLSATGDGAGGAQSLLVTISPATVFGARVSEKQGASIAVANTITLGNDGNAFVLTGGGTLDAIKIARWQDGAVVTLFSGGEGTIRNNTAGGGGSVPILLKDHVNYSITTGSNITLRLSTVNGVQAWREIARTVV